MIEIHFHKKRKAIAMIELIFAIVIMGIVMLSAPMMLSVATQSSTVAFQQESIAMIASHTNALVTYSWDEQNTKPENAFNIIGTDSVVTALNSRSANVASPHRKRELNATLEASTTFGTKKDRNDDNNGTESFNDDIDDNHGIGRTVQVANEQINQAQKGDYMDTNITLTTFIKYISGDTNTTNFAKCTQNTTCNYSFDPTNLTSAIGSSNVKFITTTLRSGNINDKTINLYTFMCNIGGTRVDNATF